MLVLGILLLLPLLRTPKDYLILDFLLSGKIYGTEDANEEEEPTDGVYENY